jgi:hypothetical protein
MAPDRRDERRRACVRNTPPTAQWGGVDVGAGVVSGAAAAKCLQPIARA